jgi:hypothetical protein
VSEQWIFYIVLLFFVILTFVICKIPPHILDFEMPLWHSIEMPFLDATLSFDLQNASMEF